MSIEANRSCDHGNKNY